MANPVYPASNNAEAIALNISNANQFFTVLQGSIDDFIPTYEGNGEIPSVAKALNEAAAYRVPLPWQTTGEETDLMQPYEYNGNVYVPVSVPAPFSAAPDNNFWRLYSQKTAQILIDNLTFDGDGVTTDFSIPSAVVDDPAAYFVSIDGVDQRPTIDYTVNVGTDTLSFTSAPPSGTDNISITILGALKGALSEGIYETTAAGLDATVDGGFFNVVNTTDPEAFIDLYKNNGGSALLIDTYPNSAAYSNLASDVQQNADDIQNRTIYVGSVAEGLSGLPVIPGQRIEANEFHSGKRMGGQALFADPVWPKSEHGVTGWSPTVPPVSAQAGANLSERTKNYLLGVGETDIGGTGGFVRSSEVYPTIQQFGAFPGTVAADSASEPLKKCREYVETLGGGVVCSLPGNYVLTETFFYNSSGIFLLGSGEQNTVFEPIGVSTAVAGAVDPNTTLLRCGFSSLRFSGGEVDGPDRVFDITTISYGSFTQFTIQSKKPFAEMIYGQGNNGQSPYFNTISDFSLFGGADYTQAGIRFDQGAWTGGSNGGNANVISNLRRAAALGYAIDIRAGLGNMFTNISTESIGIACINLGENPPVGSGTATGGSPNSITGDFPTSVQGGAVKITGGKGAGQIRHISVYTASSLTVSPNWSTVPDATSTFETYASKCTKNKFQNVRIEGLASQNPDFIRVWPGVSGCTVKGQAVESLGSGRTVFDEQGDPSNDFLDGDLVIFTEVVENPGINFNKNIYPKSSLFGGARVGRSHAIEYLEVACPNYAGGVATITLDDGGVNVGDGDPSLVAVIDSETLRITFVPNTGNKVFRDTMNNGIFINVQTDASWNTAADLVITAAVRAK